MLRIKRVVIQGFKTFARKTEFVFAPGVTAIVGPNGSGKSNVTDAVRWCLGEQSFGLLRSKKTTDVIFSGSDKRTRLGMAMVSLVLDNSGGELEIDYDEVEISRRAYQDGDNEYLINGQRVRLQDITQLLAPSGLGKRTYAVIGQGLIDSVLSLKPEERRTLFEEAAGITGYQQKRTSALRRLDASQQNLERVQDILTELSPRLRYLKRQAERAQERQQVETDLKDLLHTWYGYRWQRTLKELREARQKAQQDEHTSQLRRNRLTEISEEIESLRGRQTILRANLNEQHRTSSSRHRQAEEVSRRLAVSQERQRQTIVRQEELERERSELHLERETIQARLTTLQAEVEEAQQLHQQSQSAVEHLQSRLSARQREYKAYQQQWQAAENTLRKIEKRITDRGGRLAQLAERQDTLKHTLTQVQGQYSKAQQLATHAAAALSMTEGDRADYSTQIAEAQAGIAAHTAKIRALNNTLREEEEARQQTERTVDRMQTRLELLHGMRNEGAGLPAAGRSVLQASQAQELDGILGSVASQLYVPARLERAIEVALGGALQNIITRTWQDAQNAIEHLKRSAGGRATFLPLDRLVPGSPIPAPQQAHILGNALEFVKYDPLVAPAIQQLLQRVWIAEDLTAARQALDAHTKPIPTVVTLDGEIVRPSGAVTGGTDGRRQHGSMLARAREIQELPALLAEATEELQQHVACSQATRKQIEEQRLLRSQLEEHSQDLLQALSRQQKELDQARLAAAQAQQTADWQEQLLIQSQENLAELASQEEMLRRELEETTASRQVAQEEAKQAEQAVAEARFDTLLHQFADLRAAAAESLGHLNNRLGILADQQRTLENTNNQFQSKSQRLHTLRQEKEQIQREIEENSVAEDSLRAEISDLQNKIETVEAELHQLDVELAEAETEERQIQQLLRQDETAWNLSQLALQRTEDQLEILRAEIRQDFGLAEMEEAEGLAYQPPLPLQAIVAQLPVVDQLPCGLAAEVQETRTRLRRLSNVNPEAAQEYEQAAQRHGFLLAQSDDLEKAARDLRRVIRELDERMERELRRTFEAVSREFVHFFKLLFQGGTAQLSITEMDDILNTGIEIVARPPGKRPQSLDLLSGGERSLTACALVFAILRVSPTPFCVLDEVDTTLDEANVDRFRAVLETMGKQTQFILITHNRRTLEGSNTIYGVTMGDDGISQVISLRLEGDQMVEAREPDALVMSL